MKGGLIIKMTRQRPKGKSKTTAILLAVFLSFFTWLYTYKDDAWKFWVGMISTIFGAPLIFPGILIWICAIIDAAKRDEDWYAEY